MKNSLGLSRILAMGLALSLGGGLLNDVGAQTVTELLRSGSNGAKYDLVVIGDGFQSTEQNTFNNLVDGLLLQGVFSDGVFRETMNAFNIYRINADSTDTGVTQVDANGNVTNARNTAFDYRYSGVWDRCWMEPGPNSSTRINNVLNQHVPQAEFVFIILNEAGGGGCRRGTSLAVTTTSPWTTAAHEMGHMIGNLGDEYTGGTAHYTGGEPGASNLTIETDRDKVKWSCFIDPHTAVPTTCANVTDAVQDIGIFEGATIGSDRFRFDLFRSSCNDRMRSNVPAFCSVCYNRLHEVLDARHDYRFRNAYAGDFNGDGLDDMVLHNDNSLALYLSSGAELEAAWIATGEIPLWDDFMPGDKFYVGDFDGDGMDDLYVFNHADWSIPYFALLRSNGSGFDCIRRYDLELPGWDDMRAHDQFYVGDFNGDGRDDIFVFNGRDWSVGYFELLASTGNGLRYVRRYDEELPGWDDMKRHDVFHVADFDGDGDEDIFVFNGRDWSMGYLEMLASSGESLTYVRRYDRELPGWDDMRSHDLFEVGDFDNDQREDLYVFNGEDWSMAYLQMLRSTGTALVNTRRYDGDVPGWNGLERHDRFHVADVNGDEKDDLYVYNAEDWVTEYLGTLRSNGTQLAGSWQDDWVNSWNLGKADRFLVANFNGGSGWDDLFVFNDDWYGMLRSHSQSVQLNSIYPKWIHNHNYHCQGWW